MRSNIKLAGIVLCTWWLSSCSLLPGFGKSDTDDYRVFILDPVISTESLVAKNTAVTDDAARLNDRAQCGDIQIADIMTVPGYRGSRMLYSTSDYEIRRYARARWADNVARLLALPIRDGIVASGMFDNVLSTTSIAPTHYRLELTDLKMIQHFEHAEAQSSQMHMQFTAHLVALKPVYSRASQKFEASMPAQPHPEAGVKAANQLTAQLIDELVQFVVTQCVSVSSEGP